MSEPQLKPKIQEHPQLDESTGFDYRTHIKDAKTGKLIRLQPYTKHCRGTEVLLERPPGSGNCFAENGTPIGRYKFTYDKAGVQAEKISDTHVAAKAAPVSHFDALAQENETLKAEMAAMRAEAKAATEKAAQQAQTQKK